MKKILRKFHSPGNPRHKKKKRKINGRDQLPQCKEANVTFHRHMGHMGQYISSEAEDRLSAELRRLRSLSVRRVEWTLENCQRPQRIATCQTILDFGFLIRLEFKMNSRSSGHHNIASEFYHIQSLSQSIGCWSERSLDTSWRVHALRSPGSMDYSCVSTPKGSSARPLTAILMNFT